MTGAPQDLNARLPYDLPAAKRLLAEAGYPDGFGIGLACPNDRYVNDERICQAVAAMWARAGIRVTVQSETTALWSRRTASLNVSAFMLGHAAFVPLADVYSTLAEVIHSRTETSGGLNYGRYSNPEVDRLIDKGRRRGGRDGPAGGNAGSVPGGEDRYRQHPIAPAAPHLGRTQGDRDASGAGQFVSPLSGDRAVMDLLITGGTVITMDGARRVIADGAVAIQGDRIMAVGPAADLPQQAATVIDARGHAVLPGLIDCHAHAGHGLVKTLCRG